MHAGEHLSLFGGAESNPGPACTHVEGVGRRGERQDGDQHDAARQPVLEPSLHAAAGAEGGQPAAPQQARQDARAQAEGGAEECPAQAHLQVRSVHAHTGHEHVNTAVGMLPVHCWPMHRQHATHAIAARLALNAFRA